MKKVTLLIVSIYHVVKMIAVEVQHSGGSVMQLDRPHRH